MTTTTTNQTKIEADPNLPTIRITREFDAPRDARIPRVDDPRLVVQWLACRPNAKIHEENRFKFDGDEFYLKSRGRDARPLPRGPRGVRQHAAGSPSAPTSSSSSATRCCRRSRCPRATTRTRTCASSRCEGAKERYGDDARAARARAHRVRARRHQDDGLLRVLPRRVGPRALRASRAASGSVRGGGARPDRASRTACASSTSTRSSTTCCSSGSSTRAASRCPTSTWTSTRATAAR